MRQSRTVGNNATMQLRNGLVLLAIVLGATGLAYNDLSEAHAEFTHPGFFVVTGTGPGGGPHVRVFTAGGQSISSFMAFDPAFRGGVNVAIGDITGPDSAPEIIVGAGPGGGPHVRVFTIFGEPLDQYAFFAFADGFDGGVTLATANITDDPRDELLVAPASGGGPHVKVRNVVSKQTLKETFVFDDKFLGGISIARARTVANDSGSSQKDGFVVGAGPGGGPHVKTFDANLAEAGSWFAYDAAYTGGVGVSAYDTGVYGIDWIATSMLSARGPIRTFAPSGLAGSDAFTPTGQSRGVSIATMANPNEHNTNGPFVLAPYVPGAGGDVVQGYASNGGPTTLSVTPYPGFGGGIRLATGFGSYDPDAVNPTTTSSSSTTLVAD